MRRIDHAHTITTHRLAAFADACSDEQVLRAARADIAARSGREAREAAHG